MLNYFGCEGESHREDVKKLAIFCQPLWVRSITRLGRLHEDRKCEYRCRQVKLEKKFSTLVVLSEVLFLISRQQNVCSKIFPERSFTLLRWLLRKRNKQLEFYKSNSFLLTRQLSS